MVKNFFQNGTKLFITKQTNILSAAIILMIATLLSSLLGLLRSRLLAGTFFAQNQQWQLDVYNAAFLIPDTLFQLLVLGALSSAFIPIYSNSLKKNNKESWEIVYSIITLATIGFIILSLIFFLFSRPISLLIAKDFTQIQLDLMIQLTRIMLFGQIILGVSNFFTGVLQSHQRFIIPAIAPIFYNIGIISGIIFLSPKYGIYGPTIGVIIGYILHLLVQVPLIKKLGFKYQPMLGLKNMNIRKIGKLMIPRTIGLAIEQLEYFFAVRLASSMIVGSLSIFTFSKQLHQLPIALFGQTIGKAALPMLSQENNNIFGNLDKFKKIFLSSIKNILYLSLPISVLLLVLRIPIVRIAFGAKEFPWEATLLTGQVLSLLTLSIAAYAIIQLIVRAFYALEDTKTPLIIGSIAVFINIGLSIFFTRSLKLEVLGLGLAISLAGIFQAVTLFIFLAKKLKGFQFSDYGLPAIKMLIASILTGIALWIPMRLLDQFVLDTTKTIDLIILTLIASISGLLVYIIFSKILRIEEFNHFLRIFEKFGSWRKVFTQSEEVLVQAPTTSVGSNTQE